MALLLGSFSPRRLGSRMLSGQKNQVVHPELDSGTLLFRGPLPPTVDRRLMHMTKDFASIKSVKKG